MKFFRFLALTEIAKSFFMLSTFPQGQPQNRMKFSGHQEQKVIRTRPWNSLLLRAADVIEIFSPLDFSCIVKMFHVVSLLFSVENVLSFCCEEKERKKITGKCLQGWYKWTWCNQTWIYWRFFAVFLRSFQLQLIIASDNCVIFLFNLNNTCAWVQFYCCSWLWQGFT